MEIPRQFKALVRVIGIIKLAGATFASADTPPLTPTPKPGTLAAYADSITLDRDSREEPLIITTDNLLALGEGGLLTTVARPAGEPFEVNPDSEVDPKIRDRWRKKVLSQRGAIAKLEERRHTVEAEIDRLERGKLDSKTLDRIEKSEAKLRTVEDEIKNEKAQLSRIVRQARKDGAQPGWFR
jgi:hypothetical protein